MTWISLKEFAELVYTNAESFFLKGVNALLDFTNGYGAFAIAVALIISIALFFFAKNSLKVYRVALPLCSDHLRLLGSCQNLHPHHQLLLPLYG